MKLRLYVKAYKNCFLISTLLSISLLCILSSQNLTQWNYELNLRLNEKPLLYGSDLHYSRSQDQTFLNNSESQTYSNLINAYLNLTAKPVMITVVNDGYVTLAQNWLCNTINMDIHDKVFVLTLLKSLYKPCMKIILNRDSVFFLVCI